MCSLWYPAIPMRTRVRGPTPGLSSGDRHAQTALLASRLAVLPTAPYAAPSWLCAAPSWLYESLSWLYAAPSAAPGQRCGSPTLRCAGPYATRTPPERPGAPRPHPGWLPAPVSCRSSRFLCRPASAHTTGSPPVPDRSLGNRQHAVKRDQRPLRHFRGDYHDA